MGQSPFWIPLPQNGANLLGDGHAIGKLPSLFPFCLPYTGDLISWLNQYPNLISVSQIAGSVLTTSRKLSYPARRRR